MFMGWKHQYCSKESTDSMQSYQNSSSISVMKTEIEQTILKFVWNPQNTPNSQSNLEMKNKDGDAPLPECKLYHKVILIKKVWYWHKKQTPKSVPSIYGQLISDKGSKTVQWGKNCLFNKRDWGNWRAICKRMKLDHYLTQYIKSDTKGIKDLNVRYAAAESKQQLLLLSRFLRVRLCVTPQTAAHQALLSLGFSRQEYWSGLPFPSPMHACMLSYFSHVQLYVTLRTAAHQAPLSLGFSRQEYCSGLPFPSPM